MQISRMHTEPPPLWGAQMKTPSGSSLYTYGEEIYGIWKQWFVESAMALRDCFVTSLCGRLGWSLTT